MWKFRHEWKHWWPLHWFWSLCSYSEASCQSSLSQRAIWLSCTVRLGRSLQVHLLHRLYGVDAPEPTYNCMVTGDWCELFSSLRFFLPTLCFCVNCKSFNSLFKSKRKFSMASWLKRDVSSYLKPCFWISSLAADCTPIADVRKHGASTASRRAAPPSARFQRDRLEVGGVTHIVVVYDIC